MANRELRPSPTHRQVNPLLLCVVLPRDSYHDFTWTYDVLTINVPLSEIWFPDSPYRPSETVNKLSDQETNALLSQNVIPSPKSLGGSRPYAFTEQGVAMLSSVLTSKRAVQVNIAIMRTFVHLREMLE